MNRKIKALTVISLLMFFAITILGATTPFAVGQTSDSVSSSIGNQELTDYPTSIMRELNAAQAAWQSINNPSLANNPAITSQSGNTILGISADTVYVTVATVVLAIALVGFVLVLRKRPK